jgi:hypothetical protein
MVYSMGGEGYSMSALCHTSDSRKALGAGVVARPSWASICDCCVRVSGVAHVRN